MPSPQNGQEQEGIRKNMSRSKRGERLTTPETSKNAQSSPIANLLAIVLILQK
jgi:hypothetical protein